MKKFTIVFSLISLSISLGFASAQSVATPALYSDYNNVSDTISSQCLRLEKTISRYVNSSDKTSNGEVSMIQDFLNPDYLKVEPNGLFGPATRRALFKFQVENGLIDPTFDYGTAYQNIRVGVATRAKIYSISCGGLSNPVTPITHCVMGGAQPICPDGRQMRYDEKTCQWDSSSCNTVVNKVSFEANTPDKLGNVTFYVDKNVSVCEVNSPYSVYFGDGQSAVANANVPRYTNNSNFGGSFSSSPQFSCTGYFTNHTYKPGTYTAILKKNIGNTCVPTVGTVCPLWYSQEVTVGTLTVTVGGETTNSPKIAELSPYFGKVGTIVTIIGSGFAGTNDIYFNDTLLETQSNSDGSVPGWIKFVIPTDFSSSCPPGVYCFIETKSVTPGVYNVQVANVNGKSNVVQFKVITRNQIVCPDGKPLTGDVCTTKCPDGTMTVGVRPCPDPITKATFEANTPDKLGNVTFYVDKNVSVCEVNSPYSVYFGDGQSAVANANVPRYTNNSNFGGSFSSSPQFSCTGYFTNHTYKPGTYTAILKKNIGNTCVPTVGTVCPLWYSQEVTVGTLTVTVPSTTGCVMGDAQPVCLNGYQGMSFNYTTCQWDSSSCGTQLVSANIDQNSLTQISGNFSINGTATNVSVIGLSIQDSNGNRVFSNSGGIQVVDRHWSVSISKNIPATEPSKPLSNGTYKVTVFGVQDSILTQGTLTVTSANPLSLQADLTVNGATSANIGHGMSATLKWTSLNAITCWATASLADGNWSGTKWIKGELQVSPKETTTYTLMCGGMGTTITKNVTVTVVGDANPAGIITPPIWNSAGTVLGDRISKIFFTGLKLGDVDSRVSALKEALQRITTSRGCPNLRKENMTFGPTTKACVEDLQKIHGITITGEIDYITSALVNKMLSE